MMRRGAIVRPPEVSHLENLPPPGTDPAWKEWWLDVKRVLMRQTEEDSLFPEGTDGHFLTLVDGIPTWVALPIDEFLGTVSAARGGTGLNGVALDHLLLGTGTDVLKTLAPARTQAPKFLTSDLHGIKWGDGLTIDPFFEDGVTISPTPHSLESIEPPVRKHQMYLGYVDGILGWSQVETEISGEIELRNLNFVDNGDTTWSALIPHNGNSWAVMVRLYRTGPAFSFPHKEIECEVVQLDSNTVRISTSRDLTGTSYAVVEFRRNLTQPT